MHQRWTLDEEGYLVSYLEGKFNVVGWAQVKGSGGKAKPASGAELCLVKKGSPRALQWKWLPVDARGMPTALRNPANGSHGGGASGGGGGGGGAGGNPLGGMPLDDEYDGEDPDLHRYIGDEEDQVD